MKDIIIVGGGLSGLAAAVRFAGKGLRTVVLEQGSRPGGRTYSFLDVNSSSVLDNGQHVLLSCYTETLRYLAAIGSSDLVSIENRLELSFAEEPGRTAVFRLPDHKASRYHLIKSILAFGLLNLGDKISLVRAGYFLHHHPDRALRKSKSLTVEQWLKKMGQSPRTCAVFWHPLAVSIMNESPELASAELFVRSILIALFSPSEPVSIVTPKRGLSDVFIDPAVKFIEANNGAVRTRSAVTSLEFIGGNATEAVVKSGERFSGEAFILTGNPDHTAALLTGPDFPGRRFDRFVPIITCDVWLKGDWELPQRTGLVGRSFHWVFSKDGNFAGAGGTPYVSLVMSGAHDYVALTQEELLRLAVADLHACFPRLKQNDVRHFRVIKEKRATVSLRPDLLDKRPGSRTSMPNVFLAGDWTQTGLPATIEGAILSGFTAAEEAIRYIGKRIVHDGSPIETGEDSNGNGVKSPADFGSIAESEYPDRG